MNNKVTFYVVNEEGIREDAQILAKYKLSNMNNYITYTYNEINDNNMIKIYTTGVVYENGIYSYKEIVTNDEWNEIKEVMKSFARDINEPLDSKYNCDLKFNGEEVSVRRPKKLLVSKNFADVLASKYVEEEVATPAQFIMNQPAIDEAKEELLNKTIEIPTFEELQARNKNIENIMINAKAEPVVTAPVEEFKIPTIIKPEVKQVEASSKDYQQKFKQEVEPILMDVYAKQLKHIEELEEELSKTKFDLFEKQKETLSLKKEKEELKDESDSLKQELNGVKAKMNGIISVLQGNNQN